MPTYSFKYLSQIRADVADHLEKNIGKDCKIEEFWSTDLFETEQYVLNEKNVSRQPLVMPVVNTALQTSRANIPQDTVDQVEVWVWVVAQSARRDSQHVFEAERMALLVQAYLTEVRFGTDFSTKDHLYGFEKRIEDQTDEYCFYSVSGNLDQKLSLQTVIDEYES